MSCMFFIKPMCSVVVAKNAHRPYDLVFPDPPYKLESIGEIPNAIYQSGVLRNGTYVFMEHSGNRRLTLIRQNTYFKKTFWTDHRFNFAGKSTAYCKWRSDENSNLPGSFNPITNGHIDILERALSLFDAVIITVQITPPKIRSLRKKNGSRCCGNNKEIQECRSRRIPRLVVDYVRKRGAIAIVRGLRAVTDFEYELQMALMNRKLNEKVETIFLMPNEKYTYLSSNFVREISRLGGNVDAFVPPSVRKALKAKLK